MKTCRKCKQSFDCMGDDTGTLSYQCNVLAVLYNKQVYKTPEDNCVVNREEMQKYNKLQNGKKNFPSFEDWQGIDKQVSAFWMKIDWDSNITLDAFIEASKTVGSIFDSQDIAIKEMKKLRKNGDTIKTGTLANKVARGLLKNLGILMTKKEFKAYIKEQEKEFNFIRGKEIG